MILGVLGQAIGIFDKALPEPEVAMFGDRMFQLMLRFKPAASRFGYRVVPKRSHMLAYPKVNHCHKHKSKRQ